MHNWQHKSCLCVSCGIKVSLPAEGQRDKSTLFSSFSLAREIESSSQSQSFGPGSAQPFASSFCCMTCIKCRHTAHCSNMGLTGFCPFDKIIEKGLMGMCYKRLAQKEAQVCLCTCSAASLNPGTSDAHLLHNSFALPLVKWGCLCSQACGNLLWCVSTCKAVCALLQAMKRSEQQQCIDAFNKRVGRPAPTPVQFPRPAQQAQAQAQAQPPTGTLVPALCYLSRQTWLPCAETLLHPLLQSEPVQT